MEQTTKSAAYDVAVRNMKEATEAVAAAKAAAEREEKRLEEARKDVERLSQQIENSDPDDAKDLGRLMSARDAARGRVEALEGFARKAAGVLADAQKSEAYVKSQRDQARLAHLLSELRRRDAAITMKLLSFGEAVLAEIAAMNELTLEANGLDHRPGATDKRDLRWPFANWASFFQAAMAISDLERIQLKEKAGQP